MIELHEYQEDHPNGDRATTTVPSSRFEVWLVTDIGKVKLDTFDQFDAYNTRVNPRAPIEKAANKYATEVAAVLDCGVERKTFRREIVRQIVWHEVP